MDMLGVEDMVEGRRSATVAFSAEELKPIARRNSLILAVVLGLAGPAGSYCRHSVE
jgi:hypothetical protein